jgi:putative copper resistance protein D
VEADPFAPVLFAIKLGLYGSALTAAGLGLHAGLNIVAREGFPRTLRSATIAAAIASLFATLRLRLANLQLGGVEAFFDADTWLWTWPALGPSTSAIAFGATALTLAWRTRSRVAAAIGAVALALSFGLTGHSQGLASPGLAPRAVALHVIIAAFWFAGPITLWPSSSLDEPALIARVTQFSAIATFAVPLLFALGLWLALLLAGGWTALVTSLYGQLLLAKLAAASIALALGAYNKTIVTARLRTAPEAGQRALKLLLSFDALLFLIALSAVAAATSLTGPPSP